MKAAQTDAARESMHHSGITMMRRAVGYIRVSTDMQADGGVSLEAQEAAIKRYCALYDLRLITICRDVLSGVRDRRPGLHEALATLQHRAEVLIVFRFDRLSRSLKHFCELYERYFKAGDKELVAIRESIRLDSWQGRALASVLFVFAQMESEATGERTRTSITYLRSQGYHWGRAPYGHRVVPAPDNPRYRILVDHPEEQAVLTQLLEWGQQGMAGAEMAERLNAAGVKRRTEGDWTKRYIYSLRLRIWGVLRPVNVRPHSDAELDEHLVALRSRGHTLKQIAAILNEQRWVPLRGRKFTESSVGQLLGNREVSNVLHPRKFLEIHLERMERSHESDHPGEPFKRPGYPHLAELLIEAGYRTPMGHRHWWPAQARELLKRRYDRHYPLKGGGPAAYDYVEAKRRGGSGSHSESRRSDGEESAVTDTLSSAGPVCGEQVG